MSDIFDAWKREADIQQRSARLKSIMANNLNIQEPGILNLMDAYQDHEGETRPKVQAKLAMNQVKQKALRTTIQNYAWYRRELQEFSRLSCNIAGCFAIGSLAVIGVWAVIKDIALSKIQPNFALRW